MTPIRFAILAGVSTDAQAKEEKQSIPDQIAFCRERIQRENGIEAVEPFVMDGYSRTGYDSLEVAMQEIPPLGAAIRAAHDNLYDVLIMDNFDRLGDLGFIVKTRFKKLRKQLYSARQSSKLVNPKDYDPYASEENDFAMFAQQIIQTYRINKLRRGWNVGVPDRALAGLHPLNVAYGYRAARKGEPAEQVTEEIKGVLMIKDLYMQGATLQEICTRLDQVGIKPRRAKHWKRTVVSRIILNPYYAGLTIFGRYKTIDGKRIPQPKSEWRIGKGKHQALWDESIYLDLLAEYDRRDGLRQRAQRYALTGLLTCAVCKTSCHRHGKAGEYNYINCRNTPSHIHLRYEAAVERVAAAVIQELRTLRNSKHPKLDLALYDTRIKTQTTLRARIQDGFEAGLYNATEAKKRIVAAETEIDRLTRAKDRAQQMHHQKTAMLQFANMDLDRLRDWIINDDPGMVNNFLTSLCETIMLKPSGACHVIWRA